MAFAAPAHSESPTIVRQARFRKDQLISSGRWRLCLAINVLFFAATWQRKAARTSLADSCQHQASRTDKLQSEMMRAHTLGLLALLLVPRPGAKSIPKLQEGNP